MSSARLNRWLLLAAMVCVAAATIGGGLLVTLPLELPNSSGKELRKRMESTPAGAEPDAVTSLGARRSLRGEAPAKREAATAAPEAGDLSTVQLVGTIGDAIAMLRGPDGTTALVEVGDDVNGAAVIAIRPYQIDLKLDGKKTTLVKAEGGDGVVTDPNAAAWTAQP